ncbi:alpha-galactosidase [Paenibacillus sp. HWE-109]|uniref:glycoside hydrolase family 36 protein n=1 Tax=Paenibacillus sp. HWE-109 TaxID=1306526 RepID=UPI001EDFC8B9|nr:glycoside hydrolase family 36 protein [Paenibacillus sp. HWE-109]UKS28226.1 alpha-galactosidase [Paenibacillus sp. HWE-109]
MELLSSFAFEDITVQYWWEPSTRQVGLVLVPSQLTGQIDTGKQYGVDSLVQVKLVGDDYPGGFAQGRTMRNSESVSQFQYIRQNLLREEDGQHVCTYFQHKLSPYLIEHKLSYFQGYQALESQTTMTNAGYEDVEVEMLSSYSLGGITPFAQGDTPSTLLMHRIRSKWSNEGRLETCAIEDLQLEPTWSKHGVNSERFGQVGSMPVRGFFPFVAIEDTQRNVIWGAQLAHPASWQMEVYRRDDALCISGGLADREFGHWLKRVKPQESFTTPKAYLTVVEGDIDVAGQRLTQLHERALIELPEVEETLPVIFNEFCTTWGTPSHDNITRIAQMLKGKGITYLVIDAGWYSEKGKGWWSNMGDWNLSAELFPSGLKAVVQEIRNNGMIPGIWFEFESCGYLAEAFSWSNHLLQRDGIPITSGQRRFWDFQDPFVIDYLTKKVIDFIKEYDLGYLKIDYNETIGIGCDGAESLGEGLRLQLEAVQAFLQRIRKELPHLVIENCSSGGHRLEPSMMGLTSMASFSDAHEELEIPIIAANMHRTILPRQSQIWAVLRKEDSERRLRYSVVNTFLGRMCLSGDIYDLQEEQWLLVDEGIRFYKRIAPLIKEGVSYRFGPIVHSYRHPEGWQAMVRMNQSHTEAVVIIHTFGGELPEQLDISLPLKGQYEIEASFIEDANRIYIEGHVLSYRTQGPFAAAAVLLRLKSE